MPITKEIFVNAEIPSGVSANLARLRMIGRKLFSIHGLHRLNPAARRALAVAEPAGKIQMRSLPGWKKRRKGDHLTIVSSNLWHDWPLHRHMMQRLERFTNLVEHVGADIILLQEVMRRQELWVDEWLSKRLGMAYLYARANGHSSAIGFEEGLAVLSRYPLGKPRLRHLSGSNNPFVSRLALGASITSPWGELLTFSVHLGIPPHQNSMQIASLREWIDNMAGEIPALIGGDFNAQEHSPQIKQTQKSWIDTFRHLHPKSDSTTHEIQFPWGGFLRRARLDYVFLRPGGVRWKILDAQHLTTEGEPHSDHQAVVIRIAADQNSSK